MGLEYVLPAGDRESFLSCRRAWDLSAWERGNLEPRQTAPATGADALRAALAVYYFPGMWDWQPQLVLRLVRTAFLDALPQRHGWDDGLALLEAYFHWAPGIDDMSPIAVTTEVDVRVPDPANPGSDMVSPDGRAVHYRDRPHLLAIDPDHRYWMVEHRLTRGPWGAVELLRLDERCLSWCWAFEQAHPGMRVAGTVFNELRADAELPSVAPARPERRGRLQQSGDSYVRPWSAAESSEPGAESSEPGAEPEAEVEQTEAFRRVRLPRARAELSGFGQRLAAQVRQMVDPGLVCYPTPASRRCARCAFRAPCLTMNAGADPARLLADGYRPRSHDPVPGQLGGGTWSTGRGAAPPTFGRRPAGGGSR
jgi:hypothetical protein